MALVALLASCAPEPEAPCATGQLLDATGDESVCVPEACGIGPWGNEADADLFVAVGARGGDGSQERPFGSIQEAADVMGSDGGGVVAIAGGTYVENLAMKVAHDGVVLAGRCAELVTIDASEAEEPGIEVVGGSLEVRGVTVTGGLWGITVRGGTGLGGSATLVLRSGVLEGNREVGLLVLGGGVSVEAVGVTIRETAPNADGDYGRGVDVEVGASFTATDLILEGNHELGLFAWNGGTVVVLTGAVVSDTQPRADGTGGRGVEVNGGASLDATGLLLRDNHEVGLSASSPGTTVVLSGAVVRDTQPRADGTRGQGVEVNDGASLDATDLLLEGNHRFGLFAANPETTVVLSSAVVRNTQSLADGTFGWGVGVQGGASLDATDLLLESNHEIGLYAVNPGTTVVLSGAVLRDTQSPSDDTFSRGVEVNDGASLVAADLLLVGNHATGLFAANPGTTVALSGAVVRGTQPRADGDGGRGVEVNDGASLDATDLLLESNREVGLFASGPGTTVALSGAVVRDTQARADGTGGKGVGLEGGASLDATDLLLEGNHSIGLFAADPGTTATLSGAVVRDTWPQADGTFGRGVAVQDSASLYATDLLLEGNHEVGLSASKPGTTLILSDTVVRDTRSADGVGGGPGLLVQSQARVDAVRLAVLRSTGPGAFSTSGGDLNCQDCTFEDNGFGGIVVVSTATANLTGGSIRSSQPTPAAGGGGVGLLAWNLSGFPPTVHLDGVTLSDHPGPALYFRGPGTYAVRDCVVEDSAFASGVFAVPGAIVAVNGVGAWDPTAGPVMPGGLLLADNTVSSLPTNAVLLDGSAATLDSNLFADLSGFDLYTQRCGAAPAAVELLGTPPSTNDCAGPTLLLQPLLQWVPGIWENEAIE